MVREGKKVQDSEEAYDQLKVITDAAQTGDLKSWGIEVVKLLNGYGIVVDRREGVQAEVVMSFPSSTDGNAMGIGVRHLKRNSTWAEDFFLFEEHVGLTCFYKGTQETALPEYKGTHHGPPSIQLQDSIPTIKQDLDVLKIKMQTNDVFNSIDVSLVVTASEHEHAISIIQDDYSRETQSIAQQTAAPAAFIATRIQPEFTKRRIAQMEKWSKSERMYELKKAQLEELYTSDDDGRNRAMLKLNQIFGK